MTYDLPPGAGILPPSPPSDPEMPHAWHCMGYWVNPGSRLLVLRMWCDGCGVSIPTVTVDPGDHRALNSWCRDVVRLKVPASCADSLAWRILTELSSRPRGPSCMVICLDTCTG